MYNKKAQKVIWIVQADFSNGQQPRGVKRKEGASKFLKGNYEEAK